MDYMYNACSTTARRGALDWAPIFEKTNLPVFEKLYQSVKDGTETRKSLEFNGRKTYREDLAKELKDLELNEFIKRKVYHTTPVTILYETTDHSRSLRNVLRELGAWGEQHREKIKKSMRVHPKED